jgi:hypothetical protein
MMEQFSCGQASLLTRPDIDINADMISYWFSSMLNNNTEPTKSGLLKFIFFPFLNISI